MPLVVGAPQLKRYTAFGNLFAAYRGETYRIDRHPVMSRHPVTPMDEADIRLHLGRQTKKAGLIDVTAFRGANVDAASMPPSPARRGVLFDVVDIETQAEVGRQIRTLRKGAPFVVGSSGVEYALLGEWGQRGLSLAKRPSLRRGRRAHRRRVGELLANHGPTNPLRASAGFRRHSVDPRPLAAGEADAVERDRQGSGEPRRRPSVVLYTALGPESDIGGEMASTRAQRHRRRARPNPARAP